MKKYTRDYQILAIHRALTFQSHNSFLNHPSTPPPNSFPSQDIQSKHIRLNFFINRRKNACYYQRFLSDVKCFNVLTIQTSFIATSNM